MKTATMLIASLALPAIVAAAPRQQEVTSAEAARLMKQGNVTVVDVRTPEEYRQGRLKGVLLIPLNELERRAAEIPKGKPVIVYCAVGARSAAAAAILAGKGYTVYNMRDGIIGWYRNGLPVER